MRTIQLSKEGANKLRNNNIFLTSRDIENGPKGVAPGEWIIIYDTHKELKYLSYAGSFDSTFGPTFTVCDQIIADDINIENWITSKLQASIEFRNKFNNYQEYVLLLFKIF